MASRPPGRHVLRRRNWKQPAELLVLAWSSRRRQGGSRTPPLACEIEFLTTSGILQTMLFQFRLSRGLQISGPGWRGKLSLKIVLLTGGRGRRPEGLHLSV